MYENHKYTAQHFHRSEIVIFLKAFDKTEFQTISIFETLHWVKTMEYARNSYLHLSQGQILTAFPVSEKT